jgi:hypothetical protein
MMAACTLDLYSSNHLLYTRAHPRTHSREEAEEVLSLDRKEAITNASAGVSLVAERPLPVVRRLAMVSFSTWRLGWGLNREGGAG